jgi:hypothetical protein
MSQISPLTSPNRNEQLLSNLKFAIEEVKLERKIADLEDLASLYTSTIPTEPVLFIRRNIDITKAQLKMLRLGAEREMGYRTHA